MTTQITVRLPDEAVEFIDQLVAHGDAKSRAAVVAKALRREQRRKVAERDALIYATTEPDTELDEWVSEATRHIDLSHLD